MSEAALIDGYITFLKSLSEEWRRQAAINKLAETEPRLAEKLRAAYEKTKGKI